ncbi:M15 family metallopeptidase [Dysgonomonas sp. Marseille-P4677]|uniref:M15 family metallopeptidase n=1 Tax=Dysgonomonas sp. Marseille-P4677 TaxID=2364790 RepID=UPI0019116035|nr:M15 family metallopeptidase [Dysgonomonas sp. Marseille-P4677]MBK5720327.1 M15 family metallopeptidase [Dysgonomonas sp. Marseille-P4677]
MMIRVVCLFILLANIYAELSLAQDTSKYPQGVQKLLLAYPTQIISYDGDAIIMSDGCKITYKEGGNKSHAELMNSSHMGDIFVYPYLKGKVDRISKNYDPGRIRNEELMKKMYGSSSTEVQSNLVTITWCSKLVNQKLKVTTINGIDKQLKKISDELDKHPELKEYLHSAGTFNWRKVRGANRMSSHSFGIAIDLNIKYSDYWQWDCRCTSENADLRYKNRIPQQIVDIFERYGFIWGGKWYHYDTMHFEYRPELLLEE